ncbi:MAG: AAA family ATPase [Oscillospiraceae bacterium]|nr:AAA family ATPase [Oscillospiraceae bacterium]
MTREEMEIVAQSSVCLKNIKPKPVEWLWYPYIPQGKLTIMQGDPGEGKTTLALHLAACITRGLMPGCAERDLPGMVMLQSAEDGMEDTIVPRLLQADADCSRIRTIPETCQALTLTDDILAKNLELYTPELLIIDPLQAYLGASVDMHRANEVRPVMSHLAALAEHYGTAILLIGHMNKMSGQKALYKGLGSIDITAAARSVLLVAKHPKDSDTLCMGQIKSSLAPMGPVVGFERTETGTLHYLGEQDIEAHRLLESGCGSRPREKATEFVQAYLADGRKPVKEVEEAARAQGISCATLKRALGSLGIERIREGYHYYLALPAPTEEIPLDDCF